MRSRWLTAILVVLGFIGTWEIAVQLSDVPVYLVPAPSDIAAVLVEDVTGLIPAAMVTLGEALAGLVLGASVGLALATLITFWNRVEDGVMSLALLVKSTPVIAIAPILTIWMGFGYGPKVVVTALLTFFPVLINSLQGFRAVDPAIDDWVRSIDASRRSTFIHVRWPSARPYLFAALKVAGPLALIGAVVAEWMGASSGLGRAMWLAYNNLDMPSLFAAVIALSVLSAAVFGIIVRAERRLVPWG